MRSISRTARRQSASPSHTRMYGTCSVNVRMTGRGSSWRSPCPPVIDSIAPAAWMVGPGTAPSATALARVDAQAADLPHAGDAGTHCPAGVDRRPCPGRCGRLQCPAERVHGVRSGDVRVAVPHAGHDGPRLGDGGIARVRRSGGRSRVRDAPAVHDDAAALDGIAASREQHVRPDPLPHRVLLSPCHLRTRTRIVRCPTVRDGGPPGAAIHVLSNISAVTTAGDAWRGTASMSDRDMPPLERFPGQLLLDSEMRSRRLQTNLATAPSSRAMTA